MPAPKSLCVFCGSKPGNDPIYADAAKELGTRFAESGIRLVFGGGHIGLMGVVADAVLAGGGDVTGVIPESLQQRELAHSGVADMRIVDSMHTRKALMAELSDGFIALPGGLGTFEELCEILTWAQLGFHHKPIAILNLNGYYDHLLKLIEHGIAEGFMAAKHYEMLFATDRVDELIEFMTRSKDGEIDEKAIWNKT